VGSYWLLTAAHVGDDTASSTVDVDGTDYYQQEVIFHSASDDPEHTNKADLALVRFDKEFPSYYPLYTGVFPMSPPNRLNAVMIGYGTTGSVSSTSYTARAYNDVPNGSGTKRWGSQAVDYTDNVLYNISIPPATNMTHNEGVALMFTLGDTTYEAGVGVYDSGGGTFVNDGGIWKLAGINTIRYGAYPDYVGTFAVSVPAYSTRITQAMFAVTGDDDSDGIPNWWEEQYGTNILEAVDQDGDGIVGGDEYIADTDPTDSNGVLQVSGTFATTNSTFTFDGSTARKYQVWYTTNDLADSGLTWISNSTLVWGMGAGSEIVVTNLAGTVFYRLWVTLP